jgi:hypothetical protein
MAASRKSLTRLGRAIRATSVVLYLVWVALGCLTFYYKKHHTRYTLIRDLPGGYRVHEKDISVALPLCPTNGESTLRLQDIIGKYLVDQYVAGKPLSPSDLSATPVVRLADKKMKYLFPLQKQTDLSEVLNTDSHVDICWKVCVLEDVRVLSVAGPYGQAAEYYAILEIPSGDDAKLKDDIGNYRLILRND